MPEPSPRRRWLMVVLLLVVAAVVLLPGIARRGVTGLPTAGQVDPPPVMGDCITSVAGPSLAPPPAGLANDAQIAFPTAALGDCSTEMVGEVIAVAAHGRPPVLETLGRYTGDSQACLVQARQYIGLPALLAQDSSPAVAPTWIPDTTLSGRLIGPTPAQRSVGQDWSGCIVVPADQQPYRGSIHNVLPGRPLPDRLGSCWLSGIGTLGIDMAGNPLDAQVPCTGKHLAQSLGIASPPGLAGIDQRAIDASCYRYAAVMTGNPDPTFDGRIQVVGRIPTNERDQGECLVLAPAGHDLDGSVINIGVGPLPWAG